MKEVSNRNFGLMIAYLLPGFIAMWGVGYVSPTVSRWLTLATTCETLPTFAGFLYITLASIALGLVINGVRWLLIDSINERTGLARPDWDDSNLEIKRNAFDIVVEHHYRYYQFYANSLISTVILYVAFRHSTRDIQPPYLPEVGLILITFVFWKCQRDLIQKYYHRALSVLGPRRFHHGKR